MTAERHLAVVLHCHPASISVAARLEVTVRALEGRLIFTYALDANLDRLRIPAEAAAGCADPLWRHTCFEAFLAAKGERGYCELNFAPSRAWALYRFSAYREGMQSITAARAPEIVVTRSLTALTLCAAVAPDELIGARRPLRLRLALAAVLEAEDGRLSYWASRHPPGKPDFHHPDNFTLELDL